MEPSSSPDIHDYRRVVEAPPEKGWRIHTHSFSRLWILYPNRTKGVQFLSYDWTHDRSQVRDQLIGINRFERYLMAPKNAGWVMARIYDVATNEIRRKYKAGHRLID